MRLHGMAKTKRYRDSAYLNVPMSWETKNWNQDFKIAKVPTNATQEPTACKKQIGDPPLARNETIVLNKVD